MSSEDYLTRYFQQLAKVLAALIGLREKKNYQLAIDQINQVLDTWFNLSEMQIEQLSVDELIDLIQKTDSAKLEKVKSIAELLYQKAVTQKLMEKKDEAAINANKAFTLFKMIDQKSGDFSIEIQQRIAELDQLRSGAGLV